MTKTTTTARLIALASLGAAVCAPRAALAQQTDTNPPLPNVLLLIDDSGSMERMIDGTLPEGSAANACNCTEVPGSPPTATCNWAQQPASANRWGTLVQALTGTIKGGYNCVSMPRTAGGTFTTEYQISHVNPYDTGYYLNYHRPVAEDTSTTPPTACVYAPGNLPGAGTGFGVGPNGAGSGANGPGAGQSALDFPADAIITRPYGQYTVTAPNSCAFGQYSDGIIPTYTSLVRFGLMTFDSDPSAGIGVTTGSPPTVVSAATTDPLSAATGAFTGMWSYFPNWNTGAACTYLGNPADCSTSTLMAVGARNPAAPPWEGRMVMLPTTDDLTTQEQTNSNVASVIDATRPYGATPLAGMLTDAEYYFWQDPNGPQMTDPLVQASVGASATDAGGKQPCRQEFIVLLTDGAPNLDMRPDCVGGGGDAGAAGNCPFKLPEEIAADLYAGTATGTRVTTYVVGFAVSSVQDGSELVQCSSLVTAGTLSATCSDPTKQALYGPCCELQKIALAGTGGTPQSTPAFFADTSSDLSAALGAILARVSSGTTTRTLPAYSPSQSSVFSPSDGTTVTNASVYNATFQPAVGEPWTGDVIRQRYDCQDQSGAFTVQAEPPTESQGDDFAADLNAGGSLARTFIALEPNEITEGTVTTHDASLTIRPYITGSAADGLPVYGATTYAGAASTLIDELTPDAFGITGTTCQYTSTTTHQPETLTQQNCFEAILDYETAQPFGGVSDFPFVSRVGRALGDIYHATPIVVGPPGSLLQDQLYTAFQAAVSPSTSPRKTIVYAASNDGLLHAFDANVSSLTNNEEWALMPPAVMPNLPSSYPSSHEFLLDGPPIVKDVVWDRGAISTSSTADNPWHTMLVAGFGEANTIPGYYAVDVTTPDPSNLSTISGSIPSAAPPNAPVFRWQLTTVPTGNYPIFGQHSGTPAITTLFMDPGDGSGARDIGVAILPGGQTGSPTTSAGNGAACSRWSQLPANAGKYTDSAPVGAYPARAGVQCWGPTASPNDPVPGRALVIARIDTGEILRVFTRKGDVTTNYPSDTLLAAGRVTDVPFDSPIVGTPTIYPADVGTDTTKIFVGDADGTLWRLDVSDPTPANWTGGLYLDAYNTDVDTNTTAWSDGQPFGVPPTLSLDPTGELVMNAATTTTDEFDASGIYTIYSITEKVQTESGTAALHASVNWYITSPLTSSGSSPLGLGFGERVAGPMTVFNGALYFATYNAGASSGTSSCSIGTAKVWGMDYVTPNATESTTPPKWGGTPLLHQLPPGDPTTIVSYVVPSESTGNSSLAGVVIPGVTVQHTPACASVGSSPSGPSAFALGGHQSIGDYSAGSYSIFAQIGQSSTTGLGTNSLNIALPTPFVPTTIDSWAAVFE